MRIKKLVKQIEKAADKRPAAEKPNETLLFSTGCTEFNLACSDSIEGAFSPGMMINIVGDSFAGKTYIAHSIMGEAARHPVFSKYKYIYDNAEAANTKGIAKMFGKDLVHKIEAPSKEGCSSTIEDFQANVLRAMSQKIPCIYILDSFDSISSESEESA